MSEVPTRAWQRVVVTGGAGFIGSHLCRHLVAGGATVVAIDNLTSGSAANLADLGATGRCTLVEHDVVDRLPLGDALGDALDGTPDLVLHLASPASPADYLARPLDSLAAGADGTRHALELAADASARFLLASTSEVYGDPLVHPQPETYWGNVNPVGVRAVYDEAKRYGEALTMAYHRSRGVDVCIARIHNTYGPGLAADGRVVASFVVQAMRGEPLTVYGDGHQTRSFCFIDDTVRGLLALAASDCVGPVNIGNDTEHSILELAKLVVDVVGSSSEIVFTDLPEDDPVRRRPDISLAERVLGWRPTVDLVAGLRRTIAWFEERGVD